MGATTLVSVACIVWDRHHHVVEGVLGLAHRWVSLCQLTSRAQRIGSRDLCASWGGWSPTERLTVESGAVVSCFVGTWTSHWLVCSGGGSIGRVRCPPGAVLESPQPSTLSTLWERGARTVPAGSRFRAQPTRLHPLHFEVCCVRFVRSLEWQTRSVLV